MVDSLSSFFNQSNNNSIFGLFQTISSTASISTSSIIQKSGATVFTYRGADFATKTSILEYNDTVRRNSISTGQRQGFSAASPSLSSTSNNNTNDLIEELRKQIEELRKQLGLSGEDDTTFSPNSADNIIKNRYNTGHTYSISTVKGKDIAQEIPKNINANPNISNELVFRVTRSGDLSKNSSVSYDFVEHLSTATEDDFSSYRSNSPYQFTKPLRELTYNTGVSGIINFAVGESAKNVTVTIPNDGVLETSQEYLSIGVYDSLTNKLLDSATGLIEADRDSDIIMLSPRFSYRDPLGELQQFSDLDTHLALQDLSGISLKSFVEGQLDQDERLKVNFEIKYTTLDVTTGMPSITAMTLTESLFLSADPDVIAKTIDPVTGAITANADDLISSNPTLQAAFAALTMDEQLQIDIMVTSADYVDDKGAVTSPISSSIYTSPTSSGVDDTLTLLIGDIPTYEIVSSPVKNTKEGSVYEVVVMRDQAFSTGSVEIMLADVGGSGFDPLADISFATGTTPTDTYTLDFALGQTLATLSLAIEDDTTPELEETFSATLSVPTGGTGILGSTSSIDVMIEVDPADGSLSLAKYSVIAPTTTDFAEGATLSFDIERDDDTNTGTINVKLSDITDSLRTKFDLTDIMEIRVDGTAITLSDSFDVSFAAGTKSITVEIDIEDDANRETYEGFRVALVNTPTGEIDTAMTNSFNGRITASDGTSSTFMLSTSATTVNEGGSVEVVVTRDYDENPENFNLDIMGVAGPAGSGITAAMPSDFSVPSTMVAFAAGELEKTVTIAITDDTTTEGSERFTISGSTPGGTAITPINVDINPSDMLNTFSVDFKDTSTGATATMVLEGGTIEIEVTRTDTTVADETVMFNLNSGIATNAFSLSGAATTTGFASSVAGGTITFMGTDATATITLTVGDDNIDEAADSLMLDILTPTGTTATAAMLDIDDSADAGKLNVEIMEIASQAKSITEMDTYEFEITRSSTAVTSVDINVNADGGTAFSGADISSADSSVMTTSVRYTIPAFGGNPYIFLSFMGTSLTETITLTPTVDGDTALESFKLVVVDDPTAMAMVYGADIMEEITGISISGTPPSTIFELMSMSNSVLEGGEYVAVVSRSNLNTDTVNLMLSDVVASTGIDLTMDIASPTATGGIITDISATTGAATDYQIMFATGQDEVSITFTISDDHVAENQEQFDIALALPTGTTGASLGTSSMDTVSITDNDSDFSLSITDSMGMVVTSLTEGTSYNIEVMRTGGGEISLDLDLADLGSSLLLTEYHIGTPILKFAPDEDTRSTTLTFIMDSVNEMTGINPDEFVITASVVGTPPGDVSFAVPTQYEAVDPSHMLNTFSVDFKDTSTGATATMVTEGGTIEIEVTRADTSISDETVMFNLDTGIATNSFSLSGAATTTGFASSVAGGTITFMGTDATATITLSIEDDNIDEAADSLMLDILSTAGTSVTSGMLAIDDSADAGKRNVDIMEIAGQSKFFTERDTYEFEITRSSTAVTFADINVIADGGTGFTAADIASVGISGTSSATYTTTPSGKISVTFAGTSLTETITLTPTVDGDTALESFKLVVADNPANMIYGSDIPEEITGVSILGTPPSTIFELMSMSNSVSEGGEYVAVVSRSNLNTDTVNLMLSDVAASTGIDLTMDLASPTATGGTITDISATAGAATDYQIMFATGQDEVSITFTISDDHVAENQEQFDIALALPTGTTGASLGTSSMDTVSITDNDSDFSFSITDSMGMAVTSLTEGTSYNIEVMRTGGGEISLDLDLADLGSSLLLTEYHIRTPILKFGPDEDTRSTTLTFIMDSVNEMTGTNPDEFVISASVVGTPPGDVSFAIPTQYEAVDP